MSMTVRKIAELAGVAPSTVTRTLQDSPRISQQTKARVRRVIEQYGYPAGKKSYSRPVAMIVANPLDNLTSDNFFSEVANGAVHFLKSAGRQMVLEAVDGRYRSGMPEVLKSGSVAGVIAGGVPMEERYIELLLSSSLPVVFIGKYLDEAQLTAVIPDNLKGGQLVGEHFAASGYENVYYLGGSLEINTFKYRLEGFRRALNNAGMDLPPNHVIVDDIDQAGGYRAAQRVIAINRNSASPGPMAVFASTDWMAAGAMRAAIDNGIRIPQDMILVGYSDLELARHLIPTLTSVRIDRQALGHLAARTLLDVIDRRVQQPLQTYLQPELVVRESSSPGNGNEGQQIRERDHSCA